MKYIPILFTTEMVQAILDGRKRMTRRTNNLESVNDNPDDWEYVRFWDGYAKFMQKYNAINERYIKCPYGQPGDVLWVRETWCWDWKDILNPTEKYYFYRATTPYNYLATGEKWKPSIHMPKSACRIFLQVTDVRVERLQEITEDDAISEGVYDYQDGYFKNYFTKKGLRESDGVECILAKGSFQSLWCSINGIKSWDANPLVWVIEFKRIDKPENFYCENN